MFRLKYYQIAEDKWFFFTSPAVETWLNKTLNPFLLTDYNPTKFLKSPADLQLLDKQLNGRRSSHLEALSQSRFPPCLQWRTPRPGEGRPGSWRARSHTGGLRSACCQTTHRRPPGPPETTNSGVESEWGQTESGVMVAAGGVTFLMASTTASGSGAVFPTQVAQP